jgi:hypothetical protein
MPNKQIMIGIAIGAVLILFVLPMVTGFVGGIGSASGGARQGM